MRPPRSVDQLEAFGRIRLSTNFFMRDFLYSEIANAYGVLNAPDDPELCVAAGERLCQELLEPLNATFGRVAIRSAFRSQAVNRLGNERGHNCAVNEANFAGHIWDIRDSLGRMGATACIVIPWFADRYEAGADWRALAWWIHDHLPYSSLQFFPKRAALNLTWREDPERRIDSFIAPKGRLTKGEAATEHVAWYPDFPALRGAA